MILKDLALCLDRIFNRRIALDWDKTGLQIGDQEKDIKKILVTLDITADEADEAVRTNSDLILSHHPLIFNPLDTILSSKNIEKEILKLIKNDIAVYSAHTNYDMMAGGLNDFIAESLGLININIIEEANEQWYKFVVFVPEEAAGKIRDVICKYGGGKWQNYSCCTFNIEGKGTFIPHEGSKPYTGKVGKMNFVDEIRIECIVNEMDLGKLVDSVVKAHPYEEVAYDVYKIDNKFKAAGLGRLGEFKKPQTFKSFSQKIKRVLGIEVFKWMYKKDVKVDAKKIGKAALVCGSANSLTGRLADIDCDLVVVGEISYHNALQI
ncbi:MAG TPA: Nif3-like dinuclear metal center hexameric protein, partial [Candidatus Humimicrobiaceae bacterium]|nr:Nif3-like dinuclear metal center hexameric protein [Candidatus Humimicrobiaceae bacterium]